MKGTKTANLVTGALTTVVYLCRNYDVDRAISEKTLLILLNNIYRTIRKYHNLDIQFRDEYSLEAFRDVKRHSERVIQTYDSKIQPCVEKIESVFIKI
jgi:hypothetical protein